MTVSACFAAAGVVALFLFRSTFASHIEMGGFESLITLKFGWGWILSAFACFGAACVAFIVGNLSAENSKTWPPKQGSAPFSSDSVYQDAPSSGHGQSKTLPLAPSNADCGAHRVIIHDCPTAGLGGEWILTEFPCFIGRDISAVQVLISDNSASAVHAKLYIEAGAVMISDEYSLNGTFVNGERILAPTELLTGDIATIGKTTLYFEVSE